MREGRMQTKTPTDRTSTQPFSAERFVFHYSEDSRTLQSMSQDTKDSCIPVRSGNNQLEVCDGKAGAFYSAWTLCQSLHQAGLH